jgi:hypothetical protein
VYSPAAHNVPVLLKKTDSKLAINLSTGTFGKTRANSIVKESKNRGIDIQGAYALTDHFALQASYYHRTETNEGDYNAGNLDSVVLQYTRNMAEFGVGYSKPLANNKRAILQVFAGVGFGKFGFTDIGRDENNVYHNKYHQANVTKLYLQPSIIIRSRANYAASLSSRFSVIYFYNIHTDYTAVDLDNYKLDSLQGHPRLFWEPAVINTFGFRKIPGLQVEVQAGLSLLESRLFIDYRSFNFSAGVLFDIPKLLRKRK